jgi:DNA-binding NarL/FixJ family response regulator
MVTDKLKELESARAKLAQLEQSIADELTKELAALPAKYGFASAEEFASAVRAAAGGRVRRGRRGRPAGPAKAKPAKAGRKGRKKRAVITDETRAQLKKLVNDGKTGEQIAKALNISLPTVQNIKKALGLVKKR